MGQTVYRDDHARALRYTAEHDPDTLSIDTSPSGKYREHWSPGSTAHTISTTTSTVLDDVHETFGWAPTT